jgi:acyl carrier protein
VEGRAAVTPTAADVQAWLVARVAELTGTPPADLDPAEPVTRYGLDSVAAITLAAELEGRFGFRFRENPFDEHPTLAGIAHFVAEQAARCPPQ